MSAVDQLFEEGARTAEALSLESLRHIFHSIPFDQEFDLSGGRRGKITKFVEPRDDDGEVAAGIDVKWWPVDQPDQVSHIEFTIMRTGWGQAVANPVPFNPETDLPTEIPGHG